MPTKRKRAKSPIPGRWNRPPVEPELAHAPEFMVNYDMPGMVQVRRERPGGRLGPVETFTTEEWERLLGLKTKRARKNG